MLTTAIQCEQRGTVEWGVVMKKHDTLSMAY